MFRLDFKYSKKNLERETRKLDWANASVADLTFVFTRGRVELWLDKENLCRNWQDCTVLDFSVCFLAIVEQLWKAGGTELFEFTEGEGEIRFMRQGDEATLEIDYAGEPLQSFSVQIQVLRDEARRFAKSVMEDAIKRHPEILKNTEFRTWHPFGGTLL